MIVCKMCGTQNEDGAVSCSKCFAILGLSNSGSSSNQGTGNGSPFDRYSNKEQPSRNNVVQRTNYTSGSDDRAEKAVSVVAIILYVIAGLVILTGIIIAVQESTFVWAMAGFISGMMFIGFGKIISLLTQINSKL